MSTFDPHAARAIADAVKELLSKKHLYQCVKPDFGFVSKVARSVEAQEEHRPHGRASVRSAPPPAEQIAANALRRIENAVWLPMGARFGFYDIESASIPFELPTINTFCDECKKTPPFKPVGDRVMFSVDSATSQRYILGYQCQQCEAAPVQFMVRRKGAKLQLAGRDPIEVLPAPKELPPAQSRYFGDAHIAHHAGQTLAGLFLLRTFIEQFWHSLPEVQALLKENPKAAGEAKGKRYQDTLNPLLNQTFPSLTEVYGDLSDAIHEAHASSELFESAAVRIVDHFRARSMHAKYPIPLPSTMEPLRTSAPPA